MKLEYLHKCKMAQDYPQKSWMVGNGEGIQEIDQERWGLDQGLKSTWAR